MSSMLGNVAIASDSSEVARRALEADQCALVVVDIQEKLLPPIFNKETLIKNSQLLIRLAKILSIPLLVTTQYCKGLGPTVPEIASLLTDVPAFDKMEFSCFGSGEFRSRLKSLPGSRNRPRRHRLPCPGRRARRHRNRPARRHRRLCHLLRRIRRHLRDRRQSRLAW